MFKSYVFLLFFSLAITRVLAFENSEIFYDKTKLESFETEILNHFSNHPYNLGISMSDVSLYEWKNLYRVFPDPLRIEAEKSENDRVRVTLKRYGLYQDPTEPMPAAFSKLNSIRYRVNCLFCHAGSIPSPNGPKFRVGAPNTRGNVTAYFSDRVELNTRYPKFSSANRPIDQLVFPAFRKILLKLKLNSNRGTPASWKFSSIELSTRTDNMNYDLVGLVRLLGGNSDAFGVATVDMDGLPWWNTPFKKHFFMDGFIPVSGRALTTIIPGPFNHLKKYESSLDELVIKMNNIPSPQYPLPVDEEKVMRGKISFENNCTKCHGSYSLDGGVDYPEKVIPLNVVQSDPARVIVGMTKEYRNKVSRSWIGNYGKDDLRIEPLGYVAPPLRGVWASAPYMHNGSVPTLAQFLEISPRVTFWISNPEKFNWDENGLEIAQYSSLPKVHPWEEVDVFDTTQFGKSNTGHPFHRKLNISERIDVLEYLKTL